MGQYAEADLEFIWACGLFEGEGSCGVYRNGLTLISGEPGRTVSIQLVMTDLDVVERFQRAVGNGAVDGPIRPSGTAKRPLYRWRARGHRRDKAALMIRMLPWLGVRRRAQAQAVIEFGGGTYPEIPPGEPDPFAEFVWACGLFEGEGTCGVWNDGRAVSVSLSMTDLDVVERFHRAVGSGVIHRPIVPVEPSRKPLHRWQASGSRVAKADLVSRMLPWLGERRAVQAQSVIDHGAEPYQPGYERDYETGLRPNLRDREFCYRGHKVTPESLHTKSSGYVVCKECRRENWAKYRKKKATMERGQ